MGLTNKRWFQVINDIVHDLAAGTGPGAALALWLTADRARTSLPPDEAAAAIRTWETVLLIPLAALTVLVATGIMRVSYRGLSSAASKSRTRVVLIKHAVFVLVFIATTAAGISAV
ncbi:MAG: hypothetical protein CVT60_00110 [Actinobacteria bacterium HGW-Actinobacteria-10]|jgi:hypothetical protein|nr:MAG: hypothetical protein CVT60_00110 [Actinobacteria bacterium HGW-Actinobacteria-10]